MSWVRFLDALTLVLCALNVAVLLTGGWTVRLGSWQLPVTRPEDVLLATLPVLALRWWLRPPTLRSMEPRRVLAVGVGTYALLFSFITVSRHYTFRTHALDLGYYVQVLWNLTQGAGAYVSLPEMHAWGDHFSPVLYLFITALPPLSRSRGAPDCPERGPRARRARSLRAGAAGASG